LPTSTSTPLSYSTLFRSPLLLQRDSRRRAAPAARIFPTFGEAAPGERSCRGSSEQVIRALNQILSKQMPHRSARRFRRCELDDQDRKSTRLNSSNRTISY